MKEQPNDLSSENSVLSCIFLDNNKMLDVEDLLEVADFYDSRNAIVYKCMKKAWSLKEPIDIEIIKNKLKEEKKSSIVGGQHYLAMLIAFSPSARNCLNYAKIVKEKSELRQIITMCQKAMREAESEATPSNSLLEALQNTAFSIGSASLEDTCLPLKSLLDGTLDALQEAGKSEGGLIGLSTGFKVIDYVTCGMQKQQLIIIAARPSQGKTALMLNIAKNMAIAKHSGLIFSAEMSNRQLVTRFLITDSQIEGRRVKTFSIKDEEMGKFAKSLSVVQGLDIYLNEEPGIRIDRLRSHARKMKMLHDIKWIAVDYIGLLKPPKGFRGSRTEEVSIIARELKNLAKELDLPIIALSQLNRGSSKDNRRPILMDLKQSGEIEEAADLVMFIHRPGMEENCDTPKSETEIIIAKHREGETGIFKLHYRGEVYKFSDVSQ